MSEATNRWKKENPEKNRASARRHRAKYRDEILARRRQRYQENKEEILQKNREWKLANPDKINAYFKNRKEINIEYKITCNLRTRIWQALKTGQKTGSAVRDLGCSIKEFRSYLEVQFKEGMNWDNFGKWHLDHVKPLSKFNLQDREEFLRACNYENIQPLWASENLSKGAKYDSPNT